MESSLSSTVDEIQRIESLLRCEYQYYVISQCANQSLINQNSIIIFSGCSGRDHLYHVFFCYAAVAGWVKSMHTLFGELYGPLAKTKFNHFFRNASHLEIFFRYSYNIRFQ